MTRAEAQGNPTLAAKFKDADKNHDGKLSRAEYLAVMTKQDATTAKNKIEGALDKDNNKAGQGATSPAK